MRSPLTCAPRVWFTYTVLQKPERPRPTAVRTRRSDDARNPARMLAATLIAGAGVTLAARCMQAVRLPRDAAPYLIACAVARCSASPRLCIGAGVVGAHRGRAGDGRRARRSWPCTRRAVSGASRRRSRSADRSSTSSASTTPAGRSTLASLRGRPFLLKFFRGHWCPYCVAELRRWEELRPELDARDIAVVTVCADAAEEIRRGRGKHGLRAVMLGRSRARDHRSVPPAQSAQLRPQEPGSSSRCRSRRRSSSTPPAPCAGSTRRPGLHAPFRSRARPDGHPFDPRSAAWRGPDDRSARRERLIAGRRCTRSAGVP